MVMTTVRTDADVKADVERELKWTPDVDDAGIGVAVEDGSVTISGEVDTYPERVAAKRAVLRVRGVRAIVNDVIVRTPPDWPATESEIAREVQRALRGAATVPASVQAEVTAHTVVLTGEVDWQFQRAAARRAVEHLRGVTSVSNLVRLRPRPSAQDAEQRIRDAIARNASLDADSIHVRMIGTTAVLTGTVRSWAERTQAGHAAWSSPHVTDVDNRIDVSA